MNYGIRPDLSSGVWVSALIWKQGEAKAYQGTSLRLQA